MMHFLNSIGAFLLHIALAVVLVAGFLAAYVRTTPHDEQALIGNGNAAAAIALGGALIGYAIVLSRSITYSDGVLEMVLWSLIGLAVQVAGHMALARLMPRLYTSIGQGDMAAGLMKASVAITLGLVNAASMTP